MIERSYAEAFLPVVLNILQGKGNPFPVPVKDDAGREGAGQMEKAFVIDPSTGDRFDLYKFDWSSYKYILNPGIPKGSVGVVPISGPMTKYNGQCGEPGMVQKAKVFADMNKLNHIDAIIQMVDTPGGEARAAGTIVKPIKTSSKPVLSFVDGMSASLGMWATSASQEVYVSSEMDQVGSIGSYVMLADFKGALEKEGIKLHEIYAPQSVDKNKDYREALNGDYSAIKEDLSLHVNSFISFIKTSRPQSARHEKEWGTGKMYYAEDAKKLGLIDGVKSFEQVVAKASWLAKRKNSK